MINALYQLANKGSLRTLSFVLALTLTIFFFLNVNQFSTQLRAVEFLLCFSSDLGCCYFMDSWYRF